MKIKILETIDLQELSSRLNERMAAIKNEIVTTLTLCEPVNTSVISASDTGQNLQNAVRSVEALRQNLYNVDLKLQDIQNILAGYEDAINSEQVEEQENDSQVG